MKVPQPSLTLVPVLPSARPGVANDLAPAQPADTQEVTPAKEGGEQDDPWPRPEDESQSKDPRAKHKKTPRPSASWLMGDPFGWIGRKIRNRKTGTVYVVRNVFHNGRVELERSWMTYSSSVQTIRDDFETYS